MKMIDFEVFYHKEELYTIIPIQSHFSGPPQEYKVKPLYDFLKNESLVKNKENLIAEYSSSTRDLKKLDFKFAGKFFYHGVDSADNLFSFTAGFKNPFVHHPTIFEDCFQVTKQASADITIVPYNTVSHYQIYYTNGEISGLCLVTKSNTMITVEYEKHDDFVKAINEFNRWRKNCEINLQSPAN